MLFKPTALIDALRSRTPEVRALCVAALAEDWEKYINLAPQPFVKTMSINTMAHLAADPKNAKSFADLLRENPSVPLLKAIETQKEAIAEPAACTVM